MVGLRMPYGVTSSSRRISDHASSFSQAQRCLPWSGYWSRWMQRFVNVQWRSPGLGWYHWHSVGRCERHRRTSRIGRDSCWRPQEHFRRRHARSSWDNSNHWRCFEPHDHGRRGTQRHRRCIRRWRYARHWWNLERSNGRCGKRRLISCWWNCGGRNLECNDRRNWERSHRRHGNERERNQGWGLAPTAERPSSRFRGECSPTMGTPPTIQQLMCNAF